MGHSRHPLGKVLVALDLSPASAQVLDRAVRLPITRGSSLSLFHVVPLASLRSPDDAEPALARAQRLLEAQAARVSGRLPADVDALVSATVGTPATAIVQRAHDEDADLVVLGRHGHRTFAEALLGSTSARVLHGGTTPALIVNQDAHAGYRRALVAADLSGTSQSATALALRLLEVDPEVRVLHADDGRAHDVTTAMLELLEPFGSAAVAWDVVDRRGDARAVILAEAAAWKPDLLVLGTHGHQAVVAHLLGSVAEAVVRAARCDVLLARPGSAALGLT
jgi:nucleotide-binding universal stress UspA family protein